MSLLKAALTGRREGLGSLLRKCQNLLLLDCKTLSRGRLNDDSECTNLADLTQLCNEEKQVKQVKRSHYGGVDKNTLRQYENLRDQLLRSTNSLARQA